MYKCSCTCLYNGASETLSREFTKGYKSCHCHSLHTLMRLNTSTHRCINIHLGTRITPVTAPIRNGYFYIKPIPLALWKREEYGVQTLKKVKFINCHTTWVSIKRFHSEPSNIPLGAVLCTLKVAKTSHLPLNGKNSSKVICSYIVPSYFPSGSFIILQKSWLNQLMVKPCINRQ